METFVCFHPFTRQLEIYRECLDRGCERPTTPFCSGAPGYCIEHGPPYIEGVVRYLPGLCMAPASKASSGASTASKRGAKASAAAPASKASTGRPGAAGRAVSTVFYDASDAICIEYRGDVLRGAIPYDALKVWFTGPNREWQMDIPERAEGFTVQGESFAWIPGPCCPQFRKWAAGMARVFGEPHDPACPLRGKAGMMVRLRKRLGD